jgi:hypothetical protein
VAAWIDFRKTWHPLFRGRSSLPSSMSLAFLRRAFALLTRPCPNPVPLRISPFVVHPGHIARIFPVHFTIKRIGGPWLSIRGLRVRIPSASLKEQPQIIGFAAVFASLPRKLRILFGGIAGWPCVAIGCDDRGL